MKYKTKESKELDKTSAELNGDRSEVQAELDAVQEYLAGIEAKCIAKAETYATRKERREAEIAGLKEALQILESETALVQGRTVRRHLRGGVLHMSSGSTMAQTNVCSNIHSPSALPYNFRTSKLDNSYSQFGQDIKLNRILGSIQNGFFLESGAADGELNSNTIFYEMKGWSGLLVEPIPHSFHRLLRKHRHAYAYNGGLSTTGAPGTIRLEVEDCAGGFMDGQCSKLADGYSHTAVEIPVVPVHALLDCLGRRTIDFWSLDVEGMEGDILKTTPFDKIEVGVLLIEMNKSSRNDNAIHKVMTDNGFLRVGTTYLDGIYANPKYFAARGLHMPRWV